MTCSPPKRSWHPSRRVVVAAVTGLAAGLICPILPFPATAQGTAAPEEGLNAFMRLSAQLTSRDDLFQSQGRIAYEALSARFPDFPERMAQLTGFMNDRGIGVSGLQAMLDEAKAEFAWVPRQIISAWYLGMVGAPEGPADADAGLMPSTAVQGTPPRQVVAWEQALMFAPLAGTIPVPSYAFSGNWAEKPKAER